MPTSSDVAKQLIAATDTWLNAERNSDGSINPGRLATAMAVTQHLRTSFPLTEDVIATRSQIRGQGGPALKKLLAHFGETRKFLTEGGRTSRGSRDAGLQLGAQLSAAGATSGFTSLDDIARLEAVEELQTWLVGRFGPEYFDLQRLSADLIDPALPARAAIGAILQAAIERGGTAAGAVAQHLVGAKLTLRFPTEPIGRDSYTTADQQTARAGDFQVGDTAIHVTMSPSEALFTARCTQNIQDGFRPVVVIPESKLAGAAQLADLAGLDGRVDILGIESFVGLNVEEMATFRTINVKSGLRQLLEEFNLRIREIESNPSLQVDIPTNL